MARALAAMFFMVMLLLADCEDIFTGGHGFGMRKQGTTSDHWIDEFYYWLEARGFTKP